MSESDDEVYVSVKWHKMESISFIEWISSVFLYMTKKSFSQTHTVTRHNGKCLLCLGICVLHEKKRVLDSQHEWMSGCSAYMYFYTYFTSTVVSEQEDGNGMKNSPKTSTLFSFCCCLHHRKYLILCQC